MLSDAADSSVITALAALLVARLQIWSEGTLAALCARGPAREDPGEALVAQLWDHRDKLRSWLQSAQDAGQGGPVALAMRTWLRRWLWSRNQFLTLDKDALAQLSVRVLHNVHPLARRGPGSAHEDLRARLAVTLGQAA